MQTGFWRRHRWLMWIGGGLLAAAMAVAGVVLVLAHRAEPMLRATIVEQLHQHFQSQHQEFFSIQHGAFQQSTTTTSLLQHADCLSQQKIQIAEISMESLVHQQCLDKMLHG